MFLACLHGDLATSPPTARTLGVALRRLAVMDERITAQAAVRDRLAAAPAEATGRTRTDPAGGLTSPPSSYDPSTDARNSPTQPSSSRPTSGLPPTFAVFGRGTRIWWTAGLMTEPG